MNKILKIKDIMSVNVVSFSVDTSVDEIVSTMQKKRISSVIIIDGKKPLGIITERDIVKASLSPEKTIHMSVTELMSSPVKTMSSHADYRDAYMKMNEEKIRHIVVTNREGELIGILSESNFLNHLSPDQLLAIKEVSKVMTKAVITCNPNDTLRSVLKQMVDKQIGGIVVEENHKAVGIISERDALKFIQQSKDLLNQAVSNFMSTPVDTIHERQTVLNAQTMMDNLTIRRLIVVDNDENIVGIISRHDLIKHIPEYYVEILKEMIYRQKSLVTSTQAKLDEKIIFQNAVKSLPHTLVLITEDKGIIQFTNTQKKALCNIPTINIGDNINDLESNLFELIQNKTWKDKVIKGETLHKIIKIKNQTSYSSYLHTSISAIFDENDSFKGYLYIARDISQEQTLEYELKRLTNQLQEAYQVANIGNWELDAKTLNAYWSDEICDIVGLKRGTIGGPEILKTLVKEKEFEKIETSLISALQTGSKHEMIYEVFPKNSNNSRWVQCRARRELNEDGTPKCLKGTLQDVTKIKRLSTKEERLKNSLKNATKLAKVGLWEWDVIQDITTWDDIAYEIFGLKEGSKVNINVIESLLHKDDIQKHRDVITKCLKDHLPFKLEYRIIKENKLRIINAIGNVIIEDGNVVRLSGAVQDITDLRQEEYKLKEAQRIAKLGTWEQNYLDNTLIWSDEVYRIFEIDITKEMTFEDFFNRIHHKDRKNVIDTFQKSVKENKTYHLIYRLLFSDGRIKYVSEEAQHFYNSNGDHTYTIGTVQDITKERTILNQMKLQYEAIEKSQAAIHIINSEGLFTYVNSSYLRMWGYNEEKEVIGTSPINHCYDPNMPSKIINTFKEKDEERFEFVAKRKNGTLFDVLMDVKKFIDNDENIYYLASSLDITSIKENERQLRQSATVFENTTEGVMITDTNSIILNVNEAFCKITGCKREEAIGKKASILKSGRHNKKFYTKMWASISNEGFWRGEIWNRRKNGEIYPQWLNISSVKNSLGNIENYIAVFSDITAQKETEAQLNFLEYHDHLTELPNKILLNERLNYTLSTAKRDKSMTAVMFMDIDNFKNINDSYGHTFGDELLVAVSHRLKLIIREDDTFSRIGGDEFVIVMSHFRSIEQITKISQKIMQQFEKPFTIQKKEFWVSISIGISIAPDDGTSSEVLIKNADTAMYEAKDDGKNTVKFYNDKMSATSFERVLFENALKTAIQNKEFEVYYQPQEDLENNTIIGFEALVRWHHPSLGLVPPDKFISIAEDTKMILDIGAFVLEQSCKDIKKWHDEGLCKGRIAVNVSGVQLEHSEFAEILKHNLKKYNVEPSMIEIEVTESMVMKNPDRWISILEEIHRIGVSISIDDFGTGYSSLSYLRRFPVDTLKIDQSFIQDIPEEKDACAIADAIINIADSLGINTLAEGIETANQRKFLVKRSCNYGQGYLLSKPMNGKDTYNWIKSKQLIL